ncbi:MAG: DMT family transporter, partial [Ignavibacteriales bacterium]|nr:DMT family transporter [Ignavibacteriales bacterium]
VFIGILFLSSGGDSLKNFLHELGSGFNIGDYLTIVCAILFALHIIYIDIFTKRYDFWIILFLQLSIAAVMSFFATIIFDVFNFEEVKLILNDNLIFSILYLSVFASLINYALQTKFQKEVVPSVAGIIYSFEPIFAALFAFLILNEKIANFGLIGGILIFVGFIVQELLNNYEKNGKRIKS